MIHPASQDNKKIKKRINRIVIYYCFAIPLTLGNFVPELFSRYEVNDFQFDEIPQNIWYWLAASCVLSIPLIFEFCLDTVVSAMYPIYNHNIVEHRFGHAFLLVSLFLPIIPALAFEKSMEVNQNFSRCFICSCQALTLTAIFGKLQVFGQAEWNAINSGMCLVAYVISQLALNFSFTLLSEGDEELNYDALVVATTFSLLSVLLVVWFARRTVTDMYLLVFREHEAISFSSNQYTCVVLLSIVFLYALTTFLSIATGYLQYCSDSDEVQHVWQVEIGIHVALSLCGAILPGRMIRRGMVALKVRMSTVFLVNSSFLTITSLPQHEMEHKKTFIRYISHEIRSPLSTTTLGLDYLIEQLRTHKIHNLDSILEIVSEAKVTCELATNTLNDLLMFDKMETGMLEIAAVECAAWHFIQSCVKPFQLQVWLVSASQLSGM